MQAIAQSVNTYFYSLAYDMGIDRLSGFMAQARLRQADRHRSHRRKRRRAAFAGMEARRASTSRGIPGETVIAGIGQGYWVVTPLQLAQAVSIVADEGMPHTLHLLRAVQMGLPSAFSGAMNRPST